MSQDINKCFNNDNNVCTNQQLTCHRELSRGMIVKEWVVSNHKQVDFKSHDKLIVKMCVK